MTYLGNHAKCFKVTYFHCAPHGIIDFFDADDVNPSLDAIMTPIYDAAIEYLEKGFR